MGKDKGNNKGFNSFLDNLFTSQKPKEKLSKKERKQLKLEKNEDDGADGNQGENEEVTE